MKYYPWTRASNSENHCDLAGFFYNLSSIFAIRSVGDNIKSILPISATSIKNRYEEIDFDYQSFLNEFPWEVAQTIKEDRENSFQNIIANLDISNAAKSKISQLVAAVNNFEEMWNNFDSMKEVVVGIEYEIGILHSEGQITESELGKLFCMSSTIRYATLYYNEYIPQPDEQAKLERRGLFWKILGGILCAAISIFFIGPAIVVGGVLSTAGAISIGLIGFGAGWLGVSWGLNGFPID